MFFSCAAAAAGGKIKKKQGGKAMKTISLNGTWSLRGTRQDWEPLEEIKLDKIPVAFFKSMQGIEDYVLTESDKAIILESVNNALAHPLEITESQYKEAPEGYIHIESHDG